MFANSNRQPLLSDFYEPDINLIIIKILQGRYSVIFTISLMWKLKLKELSDTSMATQFNRGSTVWHLSLNLNQHVMPTFNTLFY